MMRRDANQDVLKRTFASYHFGQLLKTVKENPTHICLQIHNLDDETIQIILESSWDDWNFGSGDPMVLKIHEILVRERDHRNKERSMGIRRLIT